MKLIPVLQRMLTERNWTQGELANKLKVDQSTVARWLAGAEPKHRHREKILELAKKIGVVPAAQNLQVYVPVVGFVGAGGQVIYEAGQGPFDEAQMPPADDTANLVAVVVKGDSMSPQLEDGWLVYYNQRQEKPSQMLLNKLCVVGLPDGRVLVKKLIQGRRNGSYDLYSANASPMLDQRIEWAAKVIWINQN